MGKLPKFPTDNPQLTLMQTQWSSIIDPVLALPQNSSVILKDVVLSTSATINHGLGRKLQGWVVVRQSGVANIHDNQIGNGNPDKTLLLIASSGITVDLLCF